MCGGGGGLRGGGCTGDLSRGVRLRPRTGPIPGEGLGKGHVSKAVMPRERVREEEQPSGGESPCPCPGRGQEQKAQRAGMNHSAGPRGVWSGSAVSAPGPSALLPAWK